MLKNENTFPGKFNDIYLSHVLCAFLDSVLRCCRPAIVGEFHLWDAPATSCSYIHQNKYPVQDDQYKYASYLTIQTESLTSKIKK